MDAGAVGIVFLTPPLFLAQAANVLTEALAYIHAALKTRLSTFDLQTISHIVVDLIEAGSMGHDVTHHRHRLPIDQCTARPDQGQGPVAMSLLEGLEPAVCALLGIAATKHRSALLALGKSKAIEPGLVRTVHDTIAGNWAAARAAGLGNVSRENWRWFKPQPQIAAHNASPEVVLERRIVSAALSLGREDWSNQVPVASGVVGPNAERRRAIDLVHRLGPARFEFIELKIASDTPLYAAIEIIGYTCIWLQARAEPGRSATTLLNADHIDVVVLAPKAYYRSYQLGALEHQLDSEIRELGERHGVTLSFAFQTLPAPLCDATLPGGEALLDCLGQRGSL